MIDTLYIEKDVAHDPRVQQILEKLPHRETQSIDRYDSIFGQVKKPYLQKRDNLNGFVAKKRGQLIKEAPNAYGLSGEPHYYFIHAYNCIYECEYCYLQGYFNSPDLVFFVNHEDICKEMESILKNSHSSTTWFHAGEFSDSLALSHITGELPLYFEFFRDHPKAKLELRTKSTQVKPLLNETPAPNIITTFSLSPKESAKSLDRKTPPTDARLKAIQKLHEAGHPIGIHFDPIVYSDEFIHKYEELISQLQQHIPLHKVEYYSLGVVRFPKPIYQTVVKNYPESDLLGSEFTKSFDQKIRYPKPMRLWMLSQVKQKLIDAGASEDSIYLCMEDDDKMLNESN